MRLDAGPPLSAADEALGRAAFQAIDADAWAVALPIAGRISDPTLAKIIRWLDLGRDDGDAVHAEIAAFIQANPGWPLQGRLRLQGERTLPPGTDPGSVVAWFTGAPPQTPDGAARYLAALSALGRTDEAAAVARELWPEIALTADQQAGFLARFGGLLRAADHEARLEALLWADRPGEARAMLPLVSAGRRAVAEARLRLAGQAPGVDAAIQAIPAALLNDEGLAFDRLRWRRRKDMTLEAVELLALQPAASQWEAAWWGERHILARRLFNEGDHGRAYAVASGRTQGSGLPLSESEFLSGWLALRFIGQPADALAHFTRLYENVGTPISLARGAYWVARANEALGAEAEAERWFAAAAQYDTTFYGQLAAGRIGRPSVDRTYPAPEVPAEAAARFLAGEPARATLILTQLGRDDLAALFMRTLIERTSDPLGFVLAAELGVATGNLVVAVTSAKRAQRDGLVLTEASYPLMPLDSADPRPEPAFILGLMRQESEFDHGAVSRAGARGLMQLMPETARAVARQIGVSHSVDRLTADPQHNIALGSAYLAQMLDRYGGSYVLAAAAYNAGPQRVGQWLGTMGYPGSDIDRIVDWVESIPIPETRNYVQRVLEATQVYRLRLGAPPTKGALERDLVR